jgi:predicted kinase
MGRVYVVVTGPPGSGKSTLSRALADELGLRLLAKDELKERLLDADPVRSVAQSREVGRRAVQDLLAAARDAEEGVLDSVWVDRSAAVERLGALGDVVEVFCRCDVTTMRRRYAERGRHPGHLDALRDADELWPPEALAPLAGGWPVVEVDTSGPVDVQRLAQRLTPA